MPAEIGRGIAITGTGGGLRREYGLWPGEVGVPVVVSGEYQDIGDES